MRRITGKLRPELERAEADARRAVPGIAPEAVAELAGPEAAARWAALGVAQRHELLTTLGTRVIILPTLRGRRFDPTTVKITWPTD